MENIKPLIEERLWNFIKRNYTSENYSNAILDAIQFLGDVIREKSGLQSDGAQLVGASLGGENPKIKLNSLTTDSEKNFQKGIESILRGIYSAYRNPRSHSKIEDTEKEAFEVIVYLNHLLKIIDKSTGKFSIELFLKRIFDKDFVQTNKYSELLTKEIPPNKNLEIAIEIFRTKENGNINNLRLVWASIYQNLSDDEKADLDNLCAEELRYTDSVTSVVKCIGLFKPTWHSIDEDARLRAENKLIKEVYNAEKNSYGTYNEAAIFGSWLATITNQSVLKEEIAEMVYELLNSGNPSKQRFAIEYFGKHLQELEQYLLVETYKELFKRELGRGNEIIHAFVINNFKGADKEEFKEALQNFNPGENLDDLPF